ncbi:Uncharacterised protein [Mycobacteroides abscessus subsp. abscessus]|nr:Uncharacterised protein [Mycobacteroides abscessus subsp. abscessus]SIG98736.1 Uncharacterised protein [Mycobacteroides abscessus subsp. abscessus]
MDETLEHILQTYLYGSGLSKEKSHMATRVIYHMIMGYQSRR